MTSSVLEQDLRHTLRLGDDTAEPLGDELKETVKRDPAAMAAYEEVGRRAAVRELAEARKRRNRSQEEVADFMGTTQSSVSDLENQRTDPRLSTLQRYARACGYSISISLLGATISKSRALDQTNSGQNDEAEKLADDDDTPDDLTELIKEVNSDPLAREAYQDAQLRSRIICQLVQARRARGQTQKMIARALETTQSAVSALEGGSVDPRLATLQRYARACGLLLDISVVSDDALTGITGIIAPSVDRTTADPVVVEGMRLATSVGVENVLRGMLRIESRPNVLLRDAIGHGSGLSEVAKVRAMKGLVNQGWLDYLQVAGRTSSRQLRLNQHAASFLGISIREDHVRGLVTGLNPARSGPDGLQKVRLFNTSPQAVVDAVVELVDRSKATTSHLMGVGVELSGPVDGESGRVLFAPDLQMHTKIPWDGFHLEAEIQDRIAVRTVVGNDASALALREHLTGCADGGLILVYLSESNRGIGAGLLFNGGLVLGAGGEGGEIGHVAVEGADTECRRCRRGRRGCLETVASGQAIARELGVEHLTAAAQLVSRQRRGAAETFRNAGHLIGKVLGDLVTVMNPGDIAVYGPRELVAGGMPSARHFGRGLSTGLGEKSLGKHAAPRFVVVEDWIGPNAAAAAAVNNFLSRPLEYAPEMVSAA